MRKNVFLLGAAICFSLFMTVGCKGKKEKVEDRKKEVVENNEFKIKRFDKLLFETDTRYLKDTLTKYQQEYRFLFDAPLSDSGYFRSVVEFTKDTVLREVYKSIKEHYSNLSWLEWQLKETFSNMKEYFPDMKVPTFYALISGNYDYYDRIVATDDFLAISLDFYVAKYFQKYSHFGLSQYMIDFLDSNNILVDCISAWGGNILSKRQEGKTLLDIMIYQGKILYFMDKVIPQVFDYNKIRYTSRQLTWCQQNEGMIWGLFIQKKLLYEQDINKIRPFVSEGPKTLNFEGSPARWADYIGWQIVKKYMDKTNASMAELFDNTDSQKILTESGYKPKRR